VSEVDVPRNDRDDADDEKDCCKETAHVAAHLGSA
jgi:hypothetical protein